jgi:hypothetical protein
VTYPIRTNHPRTKLYPPSRERSSTRGIWSRGYVAPRCGKREREEEANRMRTLITQPSSSICQASGGLQSSRRSHPPGLGLRLPRANRHCPTRTLQLRLRRHPTPILWCPRNPRNPHQCSGFRGCTHPPGLCFEWQGEGEIPSTRLPGR